MLEYITLGWNIIGTAIVLVAALDAHSVALGGFGLDSLVEIAASAVVIWQLRGVHRKRERWALRCIAVAFFALAIYISGQAARIFFLQVHPGSSPLGMLWLALTCLAMLALAAGKYSVGTELDNMVLKTESHVTLVDAYLAGAVLLGLMANALYGWWWSDPLAGLVIVYYGFREGFHAWTEADAASVARR